MKGKRRFSRLRLAAIALFTAFFGAWIIAQWGNDENWFVAIAGTGITGLIIPFVLTGSILFAFRRRWIDLAASLVLLSGYLILSGQLRVPNPRPPVLGTPTIRALSFNVNHGWHGIDKIAKLVRDENIDAFGFQELGLGGDDQAITELKALLPEYHFLSDGSRTSATRLPIISQRVLPLDNLAYSWTMLEQVVIKDGQQVRVLSVHSPSYLPDATFRRPMKDWFKRWAEVSVEQAALIDSEIKLIAKSKLPTILCGDFNMTPTCSRYRKLASVGIDSFAEVGYGGGWTMPSGFPMRRIDYIWAFNGTKPTSCKVVDNRASDHAAVVSEIALHG